MGLRFRLTRGPKTLARGPLGIHSRRVARANEW
jgi:hypothetical protein